MSAAAILSAALGTGGEGQAHLSFRNLRKVYADGVAALDGVSAHVARGEFCVVLGPSGSGKSTLLRVVNGLTDLSSGEMLLGDTALSPKTLRGIRRRVAMVHQQFNLVERATVSSNVLSGAVAEVAGWRAMLGWYPPELRARVCEVVARVGLDEIHLPRRAAALSGGQQQRVGIARALLLRPEVILADEPVASLDPAISREVLGLLREAAREQGATVLCSLHQTDLAREFADRIIGMRKGRVVFDGKPALFDARAEAELYEGLAVPGHEPKEKAYA
ncbi:phosphonate ABC transporter ATP-binding protein [Roseovarius autotrophicus]|uniref:phosphonate ABC transporter ATP-binding protein n=1 Tax=Roseovarius autotrophicus TaxID=2824121 RepID=UPI0019E7FAA1|nr:phosphonate ABC transporter ATP-binding protein [Roseovarius autotrophicus]MBE0454772.1 phosphonate ABC transporter ATP-binding protein [Roseovarius sp.]